LHASFSCVDVLARLSSITTWRSDKDTLSKKGASWDSSRFFSLKFHFPDDFLQTSSFAAAHDYILPLKPIDVMAERRTIQSCLAILFSAASVTRYQPWDTYVFPPEIVELVFLDVKACGGDVKAAASLNEKTDLARRFSHFVNLRFLQTENAVLTVLPSTPRMFDAEDVSFVDLEIKGISSLTINVFAIECAMFLPCFRELCFQSCTFILFSADSQNFAKPESSK
jgi:hypothetical protein